MEGLILIAAYAMIASVGEGMVIGVGFVLDHFNPAASLIVFIITSGIVMALAWPIALRITRSPGE